MAAGRMWAGVGGAFGWVVRSLVGELNWRPPGWLVAMGRGFGNIAAAIARLVRERPGGASLALLLFAALAAGGIGAYQWYEAQPKPQLVQFEVTAPPVTPYEQDDAKPEPLKVVFNGSAARLELADKEIPAGIDIRPAIAGVWRWEDDKTLKFQPKEDWPVGAEFKVSIDRSVLADNISLATHRFTFKSAPFVAQFTEAQFHQDPTDPAGKRVTATINFSHPVDPAELERRIVLRQKGQSAGFLGIGGASTKFKVSYDKRKLNAYIVSEPIPIPAKDTTADLIVDAGLNAGRGGSGTAAALTGTFQIPGLYGLKVNDISLGAVDNERNEPERLLTVTLSADTHEREMVKSVAAWVLPIYHPDTPADQRINPQVWNDPTRIGPEVLQAGTQLELGAVANEREHVSAHSYKFEADAGRYVYVRVSKNIKSFGGYILERDVDRIVRVSVFPKQLRIVGEGALLSLSGERKLAVMARDLEGLRFEIGRVLPQQLQHLVSLTQGSFAQPNFNDPFDDANIVERFSQVRELPAGAPGKPSYHTLDFGQYLDAEARRGVFFVKVESYDPATKKTTGAKDTRLIVVTDLGIVVKRAVDGSRDVFIQSIHTGLPVTGATIEIVGRNGTTLVTQTTDASGRAKISSLQGFQRERAPAMVVARRGNDSSFLPLVTNSGRSDRLLDLSRFDVGGVENATDPGKLSAYLFSDRGLYRPGDEIRFGIIVKALDWTQRLAGLPLELELSDPRGVAIKRTRVKLSSVGFDELRHATQEVSPTGNYTLTLYTLKDGRADAQIGATTVNVQEFQPDRLKMSVRLSEESAEGWVSPEGLRGRVLLQNLFGTPAESRRITGQLSLTPALPSFPSYRDYRFHDPQVAKEPVNETLNEAKTNERGEAELDLGLARFARATYALRLVTEGFEADGGRGVTAGAAQLVSSMPFLVGYKVDGDLRFVTRGGSRSAELIAIDPRARKIDAKELTLVRFEHRFVSVLIKQPNGTYKYESRKKDIELDRKSLNIGAAGTKLALDAETPGMFSYVVRDAQGQDLTRVAYDVAGQANLTRSLEKNAELQLTLNQRDFKAGDEIELAIVAPYAGAGLVTIERDRVYSHAWFKTDTNASTQRIRIPKELEGNGYVTVTFVRDPGAPEIYTSPLSYAAQPFSIALDERRAEITLDTPTLVKPGEVLRVKHRANRPARAVVFAIDEGILQVARYANPDPLAHFFQKRRLDVQTAQILDMILPEFKRLGLTAAPGGGDGSEIGKNLNPFKRRRDMPAAFWSGLVETGPRGGEVSFTVPDSFNGSLRVIAVAVSEEAVGAVAGKTVVRGDFVLSPNLPTTVTPGDEFEVSVGVANNVEGSGRDAKVALALATSEHFEIVGSPRIELAIGELREGSAIYRLRTRPNLGSASLTFSASLGAKSAKNVTDISVRPATPHSTDIRVGSLRDTRIEVPIERNMHTEFAKREVSIAALPAILSHGLSAYLQAYPYSCTEQLVSQGVPALILGQRPELGSVVVAPGQSIDAVVSMLRARQNSEGGFGLWAANHYVVESVSVYAQHFLLEARERGIAVPADLVNHGNDYLRRLAGDEGADLSAERARAYAIYLLTRQGIVTSNFAAALQKRLEANHAKTWRDDLAAAYLAGAYMLMKQDRMAERTISDVSFGKNRPYAGYYDGLVHDAQLLYLLVRHFPERAKRLPPAVMEGIVKAVGSNGYNTLSSAYTILALDAYAKLVGDLPGTRFTVAEINRDNTNRPIALPAGLLPKAGFSAEATRLQFGAVGEVTGYYMVQQSGFDRESPTRELKAGIEILREYLGPDDKPVTSVKLGEEIKVRLRFRGIDRDGVGDVAMVDLLPGGFEWVAENRERDGSNSRDSTARAGWQPSFGTRMSDWSPDYADAREDRIVLYGDAPREVKTFTYRIKATNVGTFTVPPAYAESMYERSVRARSVAGKITVTRP